MLQSPQSVFAVSLVTLILSCQAFAQGGERDSLLQDLKRATQALAAARASGDGDSWSRLSTAEFVVIHPDGRIHDRSEEAAELKATPPAGALVREEEQRHWYGDQTVVITLRSLRVAASQCARLRSGYAKTHRGKSQQPK